MNPLQLNRRMVSKLFWELMDAQSLPEYDLPTTDQFDRLRKYADYNTGSLNEWDMVDLIAICHYFKPRVIAEVGTFIGRSTYALAVGAGEMAMIYTCDASNDIPLPEMPPRSPPIIRHPRESSVEMFNKMLSAEFGGRVDMFFIDGRVSEADRLLMEKLSHPKTVIVLDDFEGVEKGVANAMLLGTSDHILIYPRTPDGKAALLVPIKLLQLTAQ